MGNFMKMQMHFGLVALNDNPKALPWPSLPIHLVVPSTAPGLHIGHRGVQGDAAYGSIG